LLQKRRAQEQAARIAARTLEQAVESLADKDLDAPEESPEPEAMPDLPTAQTAPDVTTPSSPAPETAQALPEAEAPFSAPIPDMPEAEDAPEAPFLLPEDLPDAEAQTPWETEIPDTLSLDPDETMDAMVETEDEMPEEIVPEFADLTTPEIRLTPDPESIPHAPEALEEISLASLPEETVTPSPSPDAEIPTETIETAHTPEPAAVYRSVLEQMEEAALPEETPDSAFAEEAEEILPPYTPVVAAEPEDAPVFRPDFNIDIEI
jgi:hypothetical protein